MTLSDTISSREMDIPLEKGDLIGDIVVVAEVIREDGSPILVVVTDDNMNWLKEDGMLSRALDNIRYDG